MEENKDLEVGQEQQPNTELPSPESQPSDDPLDQLSDVEALRQEAKKYRGIASRKTKEGVEKPKTEPTPSSDFLTKADFFRANEKKAVKLALAESEELASNWDEVKTFYTPRRGKETPEDVLEDIKDAHAVWLRNRKVEKQDPAAELSTISVAKPSGSPKKPEKKEAVDPRFKTPPNPASWY